jgi:hypothetical protein
MTKRQVGWSVYHTNPVELQFGLPLMCSVCPPKTLYGLLKGPEIPRRFVKFGKRDRCPNCNRLLVSPDR